MALPAFAASQPSFSKDETVYAVMAPDGSVTSTTVSAHLYNAAGLSGVTDRSHPDRYRQYRERRRVHPER